MSDVKNEAGITAANPKAQLPPTSSVLNKPWIKPILPFAIGAFSGMVGQTCIQPIDVTKVRIQLAGEGTKGSTTRTSPFLVAKNIAVNEGVTRLWAGLTAGYVRQLSYGMLRLGFFDRFLAFFDSRAKARGTPVTFRERAAASILGGGIAAAIANPAEVALVRMQSDGMKPAAERANYRSAIDALMRIARHEGVKGLWSGVYPTTTRAMVANFGQLAFFAESKSQLQKRTNLQFQTLTLTATVIAGFAAAAFSLPFDFLKTRLQRGGSAYNGVLDCALKVLKDEGPLRFYRGFGTYFMRMAPHTVITLFVADNIHAVVKRHQAENAQ